MWVVQSRLWAEKILYAQFERGPKILQQEIFDRACIINICPIMLMLRVRSVMLVNSRILRPMWNVNFVPSTLTLRTQVLTVVVHVKLANQPLVLKVKATASAMPARSENLLAC